MDPESEIRTVKNWLIWLWISPIFTLPTLVSFATLLEGISNLNSEATLYLLAVLGSGCWHLILLIPSYSGKSEFIRWHGRQDLLIAGGRTAIALIIAFGGTTNQEWIPTIGTLGLIIYWFFFNFWSADQVNRGDCALMRWTGHGASLPLPVKPKKLPSTQASSPPVGAMSNVEELIKTIRFGNDPKLKQAALAELEQRGMVEPL